MATPSVTTTTRPRRSVSTDGEPFVVAVVGGTILLGGAALLVLPGPAFVVIPIGLAILAIEFEWARRWLRRAREVWQSPRSGDP